MKPFILVLLFVVAIVAIATVLIIHKVKELRWRKARAKETAMLRREWYDYTAYNSYERVICQCGYIAEDTIYSGDFVKRRSLYENRICPHCGRRWKTPDDGSWNRW